LENTFVLQGELLGTLMLKKAVKNQMKIEKKLIALSTIAIMVGIASMLPLVFLMSAKAETTDEPWFSVTVPYAYFEAGNGSLKTTFGSTLTTPKSNVNESDMQYYRTMVVLNYTFNVNLKEELDDRVECYQIEVEADKALVMNGTFYLGTYGAAIQTQDILDPNNFYFNRSNWFDTNNWYEASSVADVGGGVYSPHNITLTSQLSPEGSAGEGTISHSSSSAIAAKIMEANILTITVRRLGWVTFTSNSTTAILANEVIAQVHLEKFGNGLLYNNNFIPADKLSQIDLYDPVTMDPNTGLYSPKVKP
jgi:hypothetical protein